jgi:hypothetical protein
VHCHRPQLRPLLENFRTHAAISRLAHFGVLEPLLFFFKDAIDRLPPEHSNLAGKSMLQGAGSGRRRGLLLA